MVTLFKFYGLLYIDLRLKPCTVFLTPYKDVPNETVRHVLHISRSFIAVRVVRETMKN